LNIVGKIFKIKQLKDSNNTLNIPNAHILSQQQTSNSYPMTDMASPPSYQNIATVANPQNSYDKQSIDTDYLPKYDYLTSSNAINSVGEDTPTATNQIAK
jgi:hypothetical protein